LESAPSPWGMAECSINLGVRKKHALQLFKTNVCKFFLQNRCQNGDECSYAHSKDEVRTKPDLACTSMCRNVQRKGTCDEASCRFAHSEAQLRATHGFFKMKMCAFAEAGRCKHGRACRFAHSPDELRPAMPAPLDVESDLLKAHLHHEQIGGHKMRQQRHQHKQQQQQQQQHQQQQRLQQWNAEMTAPPPPPPQPASRYDGYDGRDDRDSRLVGPPWPGQGQGQLSEASFRQARLHGTAPVMSESLGPGSSRMQGSGSSTAGTRRSQRSMDTAFLPLGSPGPGPWASGRRHRMPPFAQSDTGVSSSWGLGCGSCGAGRGNERPPGNDRPPGQRGVEMMRKPMSQPLTGDWLTKGGNESDSNSSWATRDSDSSITAIPGSEHGGSPSTSPPMGSDSSSHAHTPVEGYSNPACAHSSASTTDSNSIGLGGNEKSQLKQKLRQQVSSVSLEPEPSTPGTTTTYLMTHVPTYLTQRALLSMLEDLSEVMRGNFDFFFCPWNEKGPQESGLCPRQLSRPKSWRGISASLEQQGVGARSSWSACSEGDESRDAGPGREC